MPKATNLAAIIVEASIIYVVFIPLLCYYMYKFWKIRREPFIQHRYPTLTMVSVTSIICILFIGSSSGFLYINSGLTHEALFMVFLLILAAGTSFTHSMMCRIWLLFFSIRVNKATLNDQWQSIINPNVNRVVSLGDANDWNAWFLQKRATYGNYHWLMKRLKIIYSSDVVFLIITLIVFEVLRHTVHDKDTVHTVFAVFMIMTVLPLFVVPLLVILLLYQYIPDFYDTFGVRRELVFVARVYLFILPTFLVLCAGFAIDQVRDGKDRENDFVTLVIMTADWMLVSFGLFFAAYSMLKRYPDQLSKEYHPSCSSHIVMLHEKKNLEFQALPNNTSASQLKVKKIKLKDLLHHKQSFEVFIEHLVSEYSVESLLSVIEICQYREYILLCEPLLKQRYEQATHHEAGRASTTYSTTNSLQEPEPADIARTESMENSEERQSAYQGMQRYIELPRDMVKSEIVYAGFYEKENLDKLMASAPSKQTEKYVEEHMIQDKQQRIQRYKEIAYGIFEKYIGIGAEFEININYNTRCKYMALMGRRDSWMNEMDEFDENELVVLFQDCYKEMINLMDQSFGRFKHSSKFEQVQAVFRNI